MAVMSCLHRRPDGVKPVYLAKQSEPAKSRYVWAYEVTIENGGQDTVQLLDRYWHITGRQWPC